MLYWQEVRANRKNLSPVVENQYHRPQNRQDRLDFRVLGFLECDSDSWESCASRWPCWNTSAPIQAERSTRSVLDPFMITAEWISDLLKSTQCAKSWESMQKYEKVCQKLRSMLKEWENVLIAIFAVQMLLCCSTNAIFCSTNDIFCGVQYKIFGVEEIFF